MLLISHSSDFFSLIGRKRLRPAADAAAAACCRLPFPGAFGDVLTFKLGDRSEGMKDEPARRHRRVDVLAERSKAGASLADRLNNGDEVLERPCEPVIFRPYDNVIGAQLLQQFIKLRPVGRLAGDLLLGNGLRADSGQASIWASRFCSWVETRAYPKIIQLS